MGDIGERLAREAEADKLIHSLVVDLTKSGKISWQRFGIYSFVARVGDYTLKLLKSSHSSRVTIYVSTKDAEKDLYVDGNEVWYYLIGKTERPDRLALIRELTFRKGRDA
jgi:hypothetical protein